MYELVTTLNTYNWLLDCTITFEPKDVIVLTYKVHSYFSMGRIDSITKSIEQSAKGKKRLNDWRLTERNGQLYLNIIIGEC